jgi:hypothetical protein
VDRSRLGCEPDALADNTGFCHFRKVLADAASSGGRLEVRLDPAAAGCTECAMLFMVIERFKGRDAKAVYRRLREQGRGAPRNCATSTAGWKPVSIAASS